MESLPQGNIATVVCSGSVGLSFTSMVEFKIDSLAFTSCGRKYVIIANNNLAIIQVALYLHSTHAELVNCSFHDNLATALQLDNTSISLAGNTEFVQNYVLCGGNLLGGGGIIAHNSTLTFTGNTTFLDNNASCSVGGAIYMLYSTFSFQGINNFINNSAGGNGGAINTQNTILNSFIENLASGGAIFSLGSTVKFNGTNNFINNSAAGSGGAIFANNTPLSFSGASHFNVVQSPHMTIMFLTSVEPANSSTTQQVLVELLVQMLTVH